MTPVPDSRPPDSPRDVADYARFSEIFLSWFWRSYDHLLRLLFYNFGWALTCLCVGWLAIHAGIVDLSKPMDLARFFQFYGLYLAESASSIGWAYGVFRIFIEGRAEWTDLWAGFRKYFLKAVGVSAVSGFLTGLGFYNLYFYFSLAQENRLLAVCLAALTLWMLLFWQAASLYQWPVLFFQNPPFYKIFYKSFLLVIGNGWVSMRILLFFTLCLGILFAAPFLAFFAGLTLFFAFQCVTLEKNFLKYKITYGDKPLRPFLDQLEAERQRSWRELLKPWGSR